MIVVIVLFFALGTTWSHIVMLVEDLFLHKGKGPDDIWIVITFIAALILWCWFYYLTH